VRFAGTDDRMTVASTLGISAQPLSAFAVWKSGAAGTQILFQWATAGVAMYAATSSDRVELYGGPGGGGGNISQAMTRNTWHMTAGLYNDDASAVSANGADRTTGAMGTGPPASPLFVGCQNNASNFLTGDVAALLFFNKAISQDEEDQLYGWAAYKYGLQGSLPSDHPYKYRAPGASGHTGLRFCISFGLRQRTLR
jgi:hypothetical protein